MTQQTLPTDQWVEPDDFEFYLLGRIEGQERAEARQGGASWRSASSEGGLEGDFGHIVPK